MVLATTRRHPASAALSTSPAAPMPATPTARTPAEVCEGGLVTWQDGAGGGASTAAVFRRGGRWW